MALPTRSDWLSLVDAAGLAGVTPYRLKTAVVGGAVRAKIVPGMPVRYYAPDAQRLRQISEGAPACRSSLDENAHDWRMVTVNHNEATVDVKCKECGRSGSVNDVNPIQLRLLAEHSDDVATGDSPWVNGGVSVDLTVQSTSPAVG